VAQRIGVSRPTVWRWQQRFAEVGVEVCCATRPASCRFRRSRPL